MKKVILLLILSLSLSLSKAQEVIEEYQTTELTVALRGKVLPLVLIEDNWVFSISIGTEFRFNEKIAFGFDYDYFEHMTEEEVHDSSNFEVYTEYAHRNPRHCFFGDVRFYLFAEKEWQKIHPYLSAYTKIGTAKVFHETGYPIQPNSILNQNERFYDLGLTAGALFSFRNPRFAFDINMGACLRTKTENYERYISGGPNEFTFNHRYSEIRVAGRINFYWYLTRD